MPSDIVTQTAQGTVLSIVSNILAQVISATKHNVPFNLSLSPVMKFALFSIINNPPNILWQNFLEDSFPTNVTRKAPNPLYKRDEKPRARDVQESYMSKTNVFIKFLLDMTIGAALNNILFLGFMAYWNAPVGGKGSAMAFVQRDVGEKFWPLLLDGFKLWPLVSLVNFLFVPVDKRVLVGCLVGVGWNIYLSMLVG